MSSPVGGDLSANGPAALLGGPGDAPLPDISVGSRGGSRRRSHGLLGRDWSSKSPKAPLSPAQRQHGQAAVPVIRTQPQAAPAQQAPREGLTEQGAPTRNPREIPKTGKARDERDAIRHGMSKDTRRFHEGISAEAQDQFNKETRSHQDMVRRRLNDDMVEKLRTIREEGLRMEREERYNRRKDEANIRRMRQTADQLRRSDQQKEPIDAEGVFKARKDKPSEQP